MQLLSHTLQWWLDPSSPVLDSKPSPHFSMQVHCELWGLMASHSHPRCRYVWGEKVTLQEIKVLLDYFLIYCIQFTVSSIVSAFQCRVFCLPRSDGTIPDWSFPSAELPLIKQLIVQWPLHHAKSSHTQLQYTVAGMNPILSLRSGL